MSTTPPAGYIWDGTVEEVAARISLPTDGNDWRPLASARALAAIGFLAREGGPLGSTAEQRLALVGHVANAVDLVVRQHGRRRPTGYDGNPTVDGRLGDEAYERYAAQLDRDRPGWHEDDETDMTPALARLAVARRASKED